MAGLSFLEEGLSLLHKVYTSITMAGDIVLAGNHISSSGAINLLPSGDTDDYFTFATASNIPTIYGTGAYVRIGDAAAANRITANEDDLFVSGELEVDGVSFLEGSVCLGMNSDLAFQIGDVPTFRATDADANAIGLALQLPAASGNYVSVFEIANYVAIRNGDTGLFDGVSQPLVTTIEKSGKYASSSTGTAAGLGATLVETGKFTNSVIGDILRITAGTNCTAGWYYITTVTDADTVVLDRNGFSGATTNCTYLAYHSFTGLSASGLLTRITDGAPDDNSVEIDRDGWVILDVSQANGRLYWRANNAWHYVDATA